MLYNNAVQIKRDILYRTFKILLDNDFENLNRIPYEAAPRGNENKRCCIHKDRAVLKYRVMAALGYSIEDETDEVKLLSQYGAEGQQNLKDSRKLTVISDACSSCKLGGYYISDVCVGCVARTCKTVCPKGAISFKNGRSVIDDELCINCGKCAKVCSYNAIVKVPVPCEVSCPVNAIEKGENGVAKIITEKCINCGKCLKACPFGAIADKSEMIHVLNKLKANYKVNALIAPSIAGQFPGTVKQIKSAILDLGYSSVYEIAEYAHKVAVEEAEEIIEGKKDVLTSSCCPAYVECVSKHANSVEQFLSSSLSPMALAGSTIKKENPDVINVFIGPCIAKKVEADKTDYIDYVLTYEELGAHIMAAEIDVLKYDAESEYDKIGYNFAFSGGVLQGVTTSVRDKGAWISGEIINGLDVKEVKKLKIFDKLKKDYEFLEVMACDGGCLNGPGVIVEGNVCKKVLDSM